VRAAQLLIVDEVSMLDAAFLDTASGYLSAVRGDRAPFGGLQLVLVGDFCQLPPVRGNFAFAGAAWARLAPRTCLLTTVRRQPAADFQEMLLRLRLARGLDADFDRLEECRDTEFKHGVEPTRLCARNAAAEQINQAALARLLAAGAVPLEFETKTGGGGTGASWAVSLGIPGAVVACIGAQVMVTRNITSAVGALVAANGTRGVIESVGVGADGAQTGVVLRLASGARCTIPYTRVVDEGNTRHTATFMPLQLAWAISIHKSQGATLDALEVDLGPSIFEAGQAYVALSRARDLGCVRVTGLSRAAFRCHPAVLKFYTEED
jgi:ATP-dependent DNA helicase PIF1